MSVCKDTTFLSTKGTKYTKLSFFCVFRVLSGHFFTFLPVSKIHAHKDESRAEKEPNGDLLVEQPPGEENGGDGIEVDPVRRDDRTEFADDPVPGEVTEHRGNDSQEEEIEESGKWKEERGGRYEDAGFGGDEYVIRYNGEEAVDEYLAGDEERGIATNRSLH